MNYSYNDNLIRAAMVVVRTGGAPSAREALEKQIEIACQEEPRLTELRHAVMTAPVGTEVQSIDYTGELVIETSGDRGNHLPEYHGETTVAYCGNPKDAAERLVLRFARDCPPNCTVSARKYGEDGVLARATGTKGTGREPRLHDLRTVAEWMAAVDWYFGYQQVNDSRPEYSEPEQFGSHADARECFEGARGFAFTCGPYASHGDAVRARERMIGEASGR